jgi:hypothetical protein
MTMHHIATSTGSTAADFTNIPQTYTHLQVRITGRSTNAGGSFSTIYAGFNGELFSGSSYANHVVYGEGTSSANNAQASQGQMNFGTGQFIWSAVTANVQGSLIIDILDYTNTSKNKTVKYLMGWDANGSGRAMLGSALWINTSAINRIQFTPDSGFTTSSRIDLYGITSNPIATGA